MKKNEFVAAIAEKTGFTKKDVDAFIKSASDVILEVIANEDSVKFGDVCSFKGITRDARQARNPKDGSVIHVPEKHGYPKAVFTKNAKDCE